MLETKFWSNVLRHEFKKRGHCDRIESHATSPGRPDVSICLSASVSIDIELKSTDAKDAIRKLFVRPSQKVWMKDRAAAGGRCFILARVDWPNISCHEPAHMLIPGNRAMFLPKGSIGGWMDMADIVWHGPIDFDQLFDHMAR